MKNNFLKKSIIFLLIFLSILEVAYITKKDEMHLNISNASTIFVCNTNTRNTSMIEIIDSNKKQDIVNNCKKIIILRPRISIDSEIEENNDHMYNPLKIVVQNKNDYYSIILLNADVQTLLEYPNTKNPTVMIKNYDGKDYYAIVDGKSFKHLTDYAYMTSGDMVPLPDELKQ